MPVAPNVASVRNWVPCISWRYSKKEAKVVLSSLIPANHVTSQVGSVQHDSLFSKTRFASCKRVQKTVTAAPLN